MKEEKGETVEELRERLRNEVKELRSKQEDNEKLIQVSAVLGRARSAKELLDIISFIDLRINLMMPEKDYEALPKHVKNCVDIVPEVKQHNESQPG